MSEFQIAKLDLKPADTLVVKVNDAIISTEVRMRVQALVQEQTGHQRVLVIDAGIDLSVFAPNSNDEAAA